MFFVFSCIVLSLFWIAVRSRWPAHWGQICPREPRCRSCCAWRSQKILVLPYGRPTHRFSSYWRGQRTEKLSWITPWFSLYDLYVRFRLCTQVAVAARRGKAGWRDVRLYTWRQDCRHMYVRAKSFIVLIVIYHAVCRWLSAVLHELSSVLSVSPLSLTSLVSDNRFLLSFLFWHSLFL